MMTRVAASFGVPIRVSAPPIAGFSRLEQAEQTSGADRV
jgi:hypothetical protein